MATFAPSAARRLAIAAPMPREPPVMSAIFPSSFFDIVLLLYAQSCRTLDRKRGQATFLFFAGCMELRSHHAAVYRQDAPGRPAGLIRREIDRGLRDLLRLPQPTQRMHPFDRGLELWILQEACDTRGHDSCRADAVASDVLFRVVHRHRLGEHDDARQLVLPPAGDRHLRTFSRKDLRNRFADAGPATGHNRYLVFESHGCVLLCCRVLLSATRRAVKRERRKPSGSALLCHCIPNTTWLRLSIA